MQFGKHANVVDPFPSFFLALTSGKYLFPSMASFSARPPKLYSVVYLSRLAVPMARKCEHWQIPHRAPCPKSQRRHAVPCPVEKYRVGSAKSSTIDRIIAIYSVDLDLPSRNVHLSTPMTLCSGCPVLIPRDYAVAWL